MRLARLRQLLLSCKTVLGISSRIGHGCVDKRRTHLMKLLAALLLAVAGQFFNFLGSSSVHAQSVGRTPAIDAGAQTRGGATGYPSIIVVKTLSDNGLNSLRAAIESEGPRIIVFETSGAIQLETDLVISSPYVTIAGQTAPAPGITIQGAKLTIRTHNVIVQHVSVRPGSADTPELNQNRDAITVTGCTDCRQPTQDVRLENISASWAVDEVIGIWGSTVDRVTVRNSIVSEALNEAGHPKGSHSMGMLIGQKMQGIAVTGNLFASNMYRNPVVSGGASVIVANNFIYNPGEAAVHFYPGPLIRATVVGNVALRGPSSRSKLVMLGAPKSFNKNSPDALIFAADNQFCVALSNCNPRTRTNLHLISYVPVGTRAWRIKPSGKVWLWVKNFAGSYPKSRNPIDQRVIGNVENLSGKIINSPEDVGGWPEVPSQTHSLKVPERPFEIVSGSTSMLRIEAWLCKKHIEVGGPPTPECPWATEFYQEQLSQ